MKAPTAPALAPVELASRSAGKLTSLHEQEPPRAGRGPFVSYRNAAQSVPGIASGVRWRICGNQTILSSPTIGWCISQIDTLPTIGVKLSLVTRPWVLAGESSVT